jgi:hypothetical protein
VRRDLGDGDEGRRRQVDAAGALRRERLVRRHPGVVMDLAAVHRDRRIGALGGEEPGVETLRQLDGRHPTRHRDEVVHTQQEPRFLARFAHGGAAGRRPRRRPRRRSPRRPRGRREIPMLRHE